MNKDQIKGAAKDVAGKAEKAFGDAVKSPEHQIKGVANQVAKQFAPDIQKAMTSLSTSLKDNQRTFREWGTTIADVIVPGHDNVFSSPRSAGL